VNPKNVHKWVKSERRKTRSVTGHGSSRYQETTKMRVIPLSGRIWCVGRVGLNAVAVWTTHSSSVYPPQSVSTTVCPSQPSQVLNLGRRGRRDRGIWWDVVDLISLEVGGLSEEWEEDAMVDGDLENEDAVRRIVDESDGDEGGGTFSSSGTLAHLC